MNAALDFRDYIGTRYRGSLEEAHGAVVVDAWACKCFEDCDRVSAVVRHKGKIFRMDHARHASFELPER